MGVVSHPLSTPVRFSTPLLGPPPRATYSIYILPKNHCEGDYTATAAWAQPKVVPAYVKVNPRPSLTVKWPCCVRPSQVVRTHTGTHCFAHLGALPAPCARTPATLRHSLAGAHTPMGPIVAHMHARRYVQCLHDSPSLIEGAADSKPQRCNLHK